jgi:hypothetical protein
MECFAGLDISMKETHICVVDRDGGVMLETKVASLPEAIVGRWGRRQAVRGLCSRRAAWRQCSTMASMHWECR